MSRDIPPELWLVEGIPGSGKSTTAELLSAAALAKGSDARWWKEELKGHPATPSTLRRTSAEADFSERCLQGFSAFAKQAEGICILEGSVFQSTVRFMFANEDDRSVIADYISQWVVTVRPLKPRLLFLHIVDPAAHLAAFVCPTRAPEWRQKVVAYVERTPIAIRNGWAGMGGFIEFWSSYQQLCLGLTESFGEKAMIVPAAPQKADGLTPDIAHFFGG